MRRSLEKFPSVRGSLDKLYLVRGLLDKFPSVTWLLDKLPLVRGSLDTFPSARCSLDKFIPVSCSLDSSLWSDLGGQFPSVRSSLDCSLNSLWSDLGGQPGGQAGGRRGSAALGQCGVVWWRGPVPLAPAASVTRSSSTGNGDRRLNALTRQRKGPRTERGPDRLSVPM